MSRASIDWTAITGSPGERFAAIAPRIFAEIGDVDFSSGKAQWVVPCLHVPLNDPDGLDREGLFEPAGRQKVWKATKSVWIYCNPLKSHKTAKACLEILGEKPLSFGNPWKTA